ncbi:phosphatidate cytidylyltransferase [Tenacibaculum caenipelagi]|uniref:Phosphatidate cytidylyltransferase n=1 Tax=Tenacibaculum caenipelagi TaxID=1325435 RepID=A0A4R6TGF6_9FLAO|nr:phosphatidate cytidylyltransferase [Tenacibaculum caenipelagi]TDQ27880.1 phosphatidate cytidylyltransferase [Tenacibaculum caenipelagi]
MSNLLTRTLSALVYAVLFISAILFSAETYIGLLAAFATVCIWEFSKLLKLKSLIPYILLAYSTYISVQNITFNYSNILFGATLTGLLILLYLLISSKPIKMDSFGQKVFLQAIYLILPFYFLMNLPFINSIYNPNIIIYIILIIWTNDSFAFLVGKNFGKRKLFEKVSPKKTIEGFIGGLLFSIVAGFIIGQYSGIFSTLNWVVISIIVAVFGSLGDLVESKFKRQANIKDSGTIMPGHGGLLDRLDSLFFLAPFVYLYVHYIM